MIAISDSVYTPRNQAMYEKAMRAYHAANAGRYGAARFCEARFDSTVGLSAKQRAIVMETQRLLREDAARTPTRRPTGAPRISTRRVSDLEREQWLQSAGQEVMDFTLRQQRLQHARRGSGSVAECERRLRLAKLDLR